MKNKVLMIFTGGTIAMKVDENIDAAVPGVESNELVNMVKDVNSLTDIETIDFANIPSPHMTPNHMMDLAKIVKENIDREDLTGIVITHGTDTLEETAYFLDLMIKSEKPVIVVGSMRNNSDLGYDGAANISSAIYTACSPEAKNKGVLVVMDDEIHAAQYVTKMNTVKTDTFKSPEFGPVGILSNKKVIFYMEGLKKEHIDTDKIENKVALVKSVAGMDSDVLDFYIEKGYKGIVVEALGCGNVPPAMLDGVKRVIDKGIPLVLTSRCLNGAVEPVYGYEGGGKQLLDYGAIMGGNQLGHKLRIKLIQVLGKTNNLDEIKSFF